MALNAPEPGLPPQLSDAPSGRNFPWGRASLPFDPCPALPVPLAPLTLHPQVGGQLCARCRSSAGGAAGARPWLAPCACRLGVRGGVLFRGLAWRRGCLFGGLPARMEQKDPLPLWAPSVPSKQTTSPGSCGGKQKGKARPGERGRLNKTDDEGRSVPASFANLFRNLLWRSILFEFALESAATHRARNTDFISANPVPA